MTKEELLKVIEKAAKYEQTSLDLRYEGISELPPEFTNLCKLTSLYLSGNQLTGLPPEVADLTNLTHLYLDGNQLTELPPEVTNLTNLTSLSLDGNQLTELPPEFANLTNLTFLNLSGNQLTNLPPEVTNLTNLTFLSLDGNQLTGLMPEFANLTNLTSLSLGGNQLAELPPEVTNLTNLTYLYLSGNQLTDLPPEVTNLTNLTSLYLSGNQLTNLPPEVINLCKLTSLSLSGNQLTNLPPEFTNLTNLKSLSLSGNQLTEFPPEFTNLTNLTSLNLSENQLTELPPEFTNLTNLTSLNLSGNQLTELPPEFTNLTNLKSLYLDEKQLREWAESIIRLKGVSLPILTGGNYFSIPAEIIGTFKTGSQLTAYYFKTESSESRALNEAKLIIIGQGNAGKTSLRQRLTGNPYEDKGRTEGVEIKRWQIGALNKNTGTIETVKLNVWDFGGQEIYHTTHQFFFRARCVYLLVIDARADLSLGRINYWLRQAQAFGRNAPVIVALNKAEEKNKGVLDDRYREGRDTVLALKEKFPDIFDCILVSCEKDLEIGKIREAISLAISEELPEVFSPIPAGWFAVKEGLEKLDGNYLTETKFEELCAEIPVDEREQLTAILDALGIIVSFEDRHLSDTKVIKPEWITKGIYKILSSYVLAEENGRVSSEKIYGIFTGDGDYPPEKVEYILRLMEKYDLCCREKGKPLLLFPVAFPVQERKHQPLGTNTTHFEYQYTNEYYDSIIVRFLKNAYGRYGAEFGYWRKGLTGRSDGHQIYLKADDVSNRIEVKIDGAYGGRRKLLEQIISVIDEIHENFTGLEVEKILRHPKNGYPFEYEKVVKRYESGKPSIGYVNDDGDAINVSLDFLLDGIEGEEIKEEKSSEEVRRLEDVLANERETLGLALENLRTSKDEELSALGISLSAARRERDETFAELKQSVNDAEKIKNGLDAEAVKITRIYAIGTFLAASVVVFLWIVLILFIGWNVMEQWTYIIGVLVALSTYGIGAFTLSEPNPFKFLTRLKEKTSNGLYEEFGFDINTHLSRKEKLADNRKQSERGIE